jgi:hypothetical protein
MNKQKNTKVLHPTYNLKAFLSSSNKSNYIKMARVNANKQELQEFLTQIFQSQLLKSIVFQKDNLFPQNISFLNQRSEFHFKSWTNEFFWHLSLVEFYTEDIKLFLKLKNDYSNLFLFGKYENCQSILEQIKSHFGYSKWIIEQEINLKQKHSGLAEQKKLTKDYLSQTTENLFNQWFINCISIRSEEEFSTNLFKKTISYPERKSIEDYLTFSANYSDSFEIELFDNIWYFESQNCLIDSYNLIIKFLSIIASKQIQQSEFNLLINSTIPLSKKINDSRLVCLR